MILPQKFKGKNKIRDAKICSLYVEGVPIKIIANQCGVSESLINKIVYRNKECISLDKHYEKIKRLAHISRLLKNHPNTLAKKSTLDIIESWKKEIEGEKGNVFAPQLTVIMQNVVANGEEVEYDFDRTVSENS